MAQRLGLISGIGLSALGVAGLAGGGILWNFQGRTLGLSATVTALVLLAISLVLLRPLPAEPVLEPAADGEPAKANGFSLQLPEVSLVGLLLAAIGTFGLAASGIAWNFKSLALGLTGTITSIAALVFSLLFLWPLRSKKAKVTAMPAKPVVTEPVVAPTLTTAEAIVRYLIAQKTVMPDGTIEPLFPGVFAIFGHGNVTCLGHALEQHREELPTWRGQNEQGMALAATAYAKTVRRRQIMVATSSVGPGATNMVTAAGVAHSNRIPLLLIAGDTFASRLPDPVLQQVEHFGEPSTTVNDAFRSVSRYWDRIMKPEQVVSSLPHAVQTMLDPADCGPAFIGLPQDVAAEAYDFPVRFFDEQIHHLTRQRADIHQLDSAAAAIENAEKPLIIAGGGVRPGHAAELISTTGVPWIHLSARRDSQHPDPDLMRDLQLELASIDR